MAYHEGLASSQGGLSKGVPQYRRTYLVNVIDSGRDVIKTLHETIEALLANAFKVLLGFFGASPCVFKLLRSFLEPLANSV